MSHRLGLTWLCWLLVLPAVGRGAVKDSFDSGGVKIHYVVQGHGEPVLLIHGYTVNLKRQWADPGILHALARNYRVIALDNRGHGQSGKPHDPKQYGAEMAEDVVRLLDHLKIKKAHIVGYSMGALIACKVLVTHPDRLLSVTLGGAGGVLEEDVPKRFEPLIHSLEQGKGFGPLIKALTPPGQPPPSKEQIEAINRGLMANNDTKALTAVARGMKGLVVTDAQLKSNRVPTLALVGANDPLKKGVDELKGRLANLQVVVIPGADHITAFARPEFLKDLQEFLARHHQPARGKRGGQPAPAR
jgi:pimeloyl-ACP methyl ester carboxylesterase